MQVFWNISQKKLKIPEVMKTKSGEKKLLSMGHFTYFQLIVHSSRNIRLE